jgi:hypothetical protein
MNRVRSKLRLNYMRAWMRKRMGWIPRPVRRAIVGVIGGTLMLLALIGFILPVMPGFIFVPFGLAILAVEFAWAARWLKKIKKKAKSMRDRVSPGRHAQSHGTTPAVAPSAPPQRNAAA